MRKILNRDCEWLQPGSTETGRHSLSRQVCQTSLLKKLIDPRSRNPKMLPRVPLDHGPLLPLQPTLRNVQRTYLSVSERILKIKRMF